MTLKLGHQVKLNENLVNILESVFLTWKYWNSVRQFVLMIDKANFRNVVRMFVLMISMSSSNMGHIDSKTRSLFQFEVITLWRQHFLFQQFETVMCFALEISLHNWGGWFRVIFINYTCTYIPYITFCFLNPFQPGKNLQHL